MSGPLDIGQSPVAHLLATAGHDWRVIAALLVLGLVLSELAARSTGDG